MVREDLEVQRGVSADVVIKSLVLSAGTPDQASRPGGEVGAVFASLGALEPPYDPEALCLLFEHSNSLRQNVDAYATNIDGFGHRLDPAIDFDADDADRRVGERIFLERLAARDRGELPFTMRLLPLDANPVPVEESVRIVCSARNHLTSRNHPASSPLPRSISAHMAGITPLGSPSDAPRRGREHRSGTDLGGSAFTSPEPEDRRN